MQEQLSDTPTLSPWWRRSVLLVFVVGMIGLIFMSVQAYRYAPLYRKGWLIPKVR
jgi:nitric oxide reductase subunit B